MLELLLKNTYNCMVHTMSLCINNTTTRLTVQLHRKQHGKQCDRREITHLLYITYILHNWCTNMHQLFTILKKLFSDFCHLHCMLNKN